MEAGAYSIWTSEQRQELGDEVIVANVRELRAISHVYRKSDQVEADGVGLHSNPGILLFGLIYCT
jgi:transposase